MDQPVKEEDKIEKDISRDREGSEVGEEENETRNGFQEEEEVVDKQEEKESKGKKGKHGGGRIKRPMNAFMVWSSLERKKLAEKEPNLHNTELSKRLGQMWKEMTEEDKTPYRQEATRLKDKLMEDHPEYKYKPRRRKDLRHIQTSTGNIGLFSSHVIADRSYSAPPVPPILPSSNSLYHYNQDMIDGVGSGQTHYPYYHSTPTSPHHINSIMPHNMFPPHYYHPHLGGSPPAAFQIGGSSNQLALQQHTGHLPHLAQGGPPAADLRLECTMTSVGCDSTIPTGLVTSTYFQFPSPLVVSSSPSSPTSPVYASETPPCSPYMPSSTTSIQSYSISETSNTTQVCVHALL
ncbi:uncharacterized protein LOC100633718 [Amphimedon queenslandica]|uniref:Sex-determining region Y protein n=1 Tax=Amphimedon queenslandica TaxID=400682 RepID=B1A9Y8_AMPQE|nr:uncharacterized protein LOC100633718 [Amphimedon queenslandica]ACA04751.1 SoxF-like [Amphimedon queenslandica]|eukprot:NP_001266217.1 uncharacterized protein LOC100633718 [Amphimedon queenslandica]